MIWISILKLAWIPVVTGFIGWMTNWMAIRMLFRPKEEWRILGFRFRGLIPRRQEAVAEQIAEIVETELLSQHFIREQIHAVDLRPYVRDFTHRVIRERLGQRLQSIPLVGAMINESTLNSLENMAREAMEKEVGPLREKIATDLEARIQVKKLVQERIAGFDLDRLEAIIYRVAKQEFRAIEALGAVLGFVIGLVQMAVILLTGGL